MKLKFRYLDSKNDKIQSYSAVDIYQKIYSVGQIKLGKSYNFDNNLTYPTFILPEKSFKGLS